MNCIQNDHTDEIYLFQLHLSGGELRYIEQAQHEPRKTKHNTRNYYDRVHTQAVDKSIELLLCTAVLAEICLKTFIV